MLNINKIFWIYIFAFFVALQDAVVIYSGSTFLSGLLHKENIWIVYTIGSFLSFVFSMLTISILKKFKIDKVIYLVLFLTSINSTLLFMGKSIMVTCLQYVVFIILTSLMFNLSSIVLEEFSKNAKTGSIRGIYNSVLSSAYLLAPFISSFFINGDNLRMVFLLSSVFGIVSLTIYYTNVAIVPKINISKGGLKKDLLKIINNRDISLITIAQIGLTTFYTVMVIYTPFKLESVGISLIQYLSILLPVALSPFLIIPTLLGALEDNFHDEKEVLILSYFGLIITLATIAFCESSSILLWTVILFISRVFASMIETSTNSYLFKKIEKEDVGIISLFTSTTHISYFIFTPIFSILLILTDLKTLFLSVSFFLCFVLVLVSKIHDAKNYQKHKVWKEIWHRSKKRGSQER